MVSGIKLCKGNKIILIQFINLRALQNRVNFETNISTQTHTQEQQIYTNKTK